MSNFWHPARTMFYVNVGAGNSPVHTFTITSVLENTSNPWAAPYEIKVTGNGSWAYIYPTPAQVEALERFSGFWDIQRLKGHTFQTTEPGALLAGKQLLSYCRE